MNPGVLFTVRREGEFVGDIEIAYFLNGASQGGKAELKLPEIDPDGWQKIERRRHEHPKRQ